MPDQAVPQPVSPEWRVIAETVPGASHLRAGIPNQDAVLHMRESGRALPLLVSLSDGHGSNKCFRSDTGARIAVKKAALIIGEFLDSWRGHADYGEIESAAGAQLAAQFVAAWRVAVEADLKRKPFTTAELEKVEQKDGPGRAPIGRGQPAARVRRDLCDRRA